jgi:hypothetical protein
VALPVRQLGGPASSSTRRVPLLSCDFGQRASVSVDQKVGVWAATLRLSRTDRSSNSSRDWKVRTRPARDRAWGAARVMSAPSNDTRPRWAGVNPVMVSMNVVLPAPLGPMSPTTEPGSTARSTPSSATRPPCLTVRSCTSSRLTR